MKIAVCLYGQPRLYEQGYVNIKRFVDLNNKHSFDFFFHTWYDEKSVGQYYTPSSWSNASKDALEIKKNTINDLLTLFNPKDYIFEAPITFDTSEYKNTYMYSIDTIVNNKNINNVISSMYSKQQVAKILENYVNEQNINYDFIISIRFDFLNEINFLIEDMKKNVINCRNVRPRLFVVDHLIITNYELFIKYSNAYSNLLLIMQNAKDKQYLENIGCGFAMVHETIVTANLKLYYDNLYDILYLNDKIPDFH
jgi:hypothetical protein